MERLAETEAARASLDVRLTEAVAALEELSQVAASRAHVKERMRTIGVVEELDSADDESGGRGALPSALCRTARRSRIFSIVFWLMSALLLLSLEWPLFVVSLHGAFAPEPPSAPLLLQSVHDDQCLLLRPLRFGACDEHGSAVRVHRAGRKLQPATKFSGPRGFGLFLGPPVSGKNATAGGKHRVDASLRADESLGVDDKGNKLCCDPWCVRCLCRGNANRLRVGLCAFDGFEGFRLSSAKAAAASWARAVIRSRYSPLAILL